MGHSGNVGLRPNPLGFQAKPETPRPPLNNRNLASLVNRNIYMRVFANVGSPLGTSYTEGYYIWVGIEYAFLETNIHPAIMLKAGCPATLPKTKREPHTV